MQGVEAARKFAELTDRKERLEREVKALEAERAKLAPIIETFLVDSGLQNLPFEDLGRTVYASRTTWARPANGVDRAAITRALESCEWADAVAYNANRLSALVREAAREGQDIPEALDGLLEVCERVSVKCATRGDKQET